MIASWTLYLILNNRFIVCDTTATTNTSSYTATDAAPNCPSYTSAAGKS